MPAPILLDLTHTSHTRARSGIQRTARAICRELGGRALPVCRDPYLKAWRLLEAWEISNLNAEPAAADRRARWLLRARLRGWIVRLKGRVPAPDRDLAGFRGIPSASAFLCPEIFSPGVSEALPEIFAAASGPRAALFHDAVALRHPELAPAKTVAWFPAYLQELLRFDGIAAISEESRDALLEYWRWLGVRAAPPVVAIPLATDPPARADIPPVPVSRPTVLCVSSIEGRKNHLALLEACESLWAGGEDFELRLIGISQPQTGRASMERIAQAGKAGRPLRYDGAVGEAALESAYAGCAFTVYPSLAEGFGLPIAESLARGKPCVCSGRGAAGELARGGGCLAVGDLGASGLAEAIGRLLRSPAELSALAAAARLRPVRTWADYARELTAWLQTLSPHP